MVKKNIEKILRESSVSKKSKAKLNEGPFDKLFGGRKPPERTTTAGLSAGPVSEPLDASEAVPFPPSLQELETLLSNSGMFKYIQRREPKTLGNNRRWDDRGKDGEWGLMFSLEDSYQNMRDFKIFGTDETGYRAYGNDLSSEDSMELIYDLDGRENYLRLDRDEPFSIKEGNGATAIEAFLDYMRTFVQRIQTKQVTFEETFEDKRNSLHAELDQSLDTLKDDQVQLMNASLKTYGQLVNLLTR